MNFEQDYYTELRRQAVEPAQTYLAKLLFNVHTFKNNLNKK